jgi:hypothetical protein
MQTKSTSDVTFECLFMAKFRLEFNFNNRLVHINSRILHFPSGYILSSVSMFTDIKL